MLKESSRPLALLTGGFLALAAAMGIGRFVYTPILPFMAEAVPLDEATAGLIASANYLGYLAGALAASLGALPGTKRTWFVGGLLLSAATTGAMGVVDGVGAFTVLRFAGGLASAFVLVFSTSLVFDRLATIGRANLSPALFAGVGFGIALSAVLVAGLAAGSAGWRGFWLWSGGLTLAAAFLAAVLIPGEPEERIPSAPGNPADRARMRRLVTGYGLFGFGYVITATFINAIVRAEPGLAFLESSIWLIVGLAGIPSVAIWAALARRTGAPIAVALACVAEAIGVGLSVLSTAPAAMIAAAILLGGTFMGITAVGLVHARALTTGDPRRSVALMTAAFGLGQMAGPAFAGYLRGVGGSFVMPTLAAAAALLVAAALIARS